MPSLKTTYNRLSERGNLKPAWQTSLDDYVQTVTFSPNGKTLAAASISGPVTLYEATTGQLQHALKGHDFGTTALAWHRAGERLASAGQDGVIRLWDTTSGTQLTTLAGGAAWVEHLAWQPDGDLLLSAAGRKLRLWNKDGELVREYGNHGSTIAGVGWQPGQAAPAFASAQYGRVSLWSPNEDAPRLTLDWKGSILTLVWSPDGKFLVTGDQDATVHFWIVEKAEDLQMSGYPTKVRELSWDYQSRYLATGGSPEVTIWDCWGKGPAGSTPLQLKVHEDLVSALAFQHLGPLLASGGSDGQVVLWQPGKHRKPLVQWHFDTTISSLAWSSNDRYLAVGTQDGIVALLTLPV